MPLIRLDNATLAFGHLPLLEEASLVIEPGERICLVGRNGTGKSTLLRVIDGRQALDGGTLWRDPAIRIATLEQEVPGSAPGTVFDQVAGGLAETGELLARYHHLLARLGEGASVEREVGELQHRIEAADGWRLEQRVEKAISRLRLDGAAPFEPLSGGQKRRVMLARALVSEPDLLLLDEPTNHLDIDTIAWMEGQIRDFPGAVLFITHDRAFLRALATRILELDRGRLTSWPGDYDNYLRRKAERLAAEAQENARFDRKLAEEEAWIRQGIKARRTRNEGRVRALQKMREERRARRGQQGNARLNLDRGELSGRLVIEAEGISKNWGGEPVVRELSTLILRGDRVGLIGPNGAGKTTLLRMLLGELKPDSGRVRLGSRLQMAYFDQQREALDPEHSVADSLGQGKETITVGGRSRHVVSYLQEFLFPPDRIRSPVKSLSGGERNRLLLARLFARPANLLVMDEPTNDLDVETLELLEELLLEYDGTLLLVSHDRAFLDNVVTSTLAFEGDGVVREYVGGYSDWLRQRPAAPAVEEVPDRRQEGESPRSEPPRRRRKLGYREQRELEALPERIEALEAEQATLQERAASPAFYKGDKEEITATLARLERVEEELEAAYRRWERLLEQSE